MMTSKFPKLNLLMAFPYFKTPVVEHLVQSETAKDLNILLDSGAFTAWKAGKPIEINTYMDFIRKLPLNLYGYFMLDVIGDVEGTKRNYQTMLDKGLSPIPIFTRGESFDELESYYERTDYIAIGGLVGTPGNHGFVKALMPRIGQRKVHLLGYTAENMVRHFRPFSIDSSTVSSVARYGNVRLYAGGGQWMMMNKKIMASVKPDSPIFRVLQQYDFDFMELRRKDRWTNKSENNGLLQSLAFKSYVRYSLDLERVLGTKYFLAVAHIKEVQQAEEAYRWARKKYANLYARSVQ